MMEYTPNIDRNNPEATLKRLKTAEDACRQALIDAREEPATEAVQESLYFSWAQAKQARQDFEESLKTKE